MGAAHDAWKVNSDGEYLEGDPADGGGPLYRDRYAALFGGRG